MSEIAGHLSNSLYLKRGITAKEKGMLRKRAVLLGMLLAWFAGILSGQPGYLQQILAWRQAQETDIKSDTGWLTVVGLFWLKAKLEAWHQLAGVGTRRVPSL
jgi:hypothetical protein